MVRKYLSENEIFVKVQKLWPAGGKISHGPSSVSYRAKGTQLQFWSRGAHFEEETISVLHLLAESTGAPSEPKEQLVANLSRTNDFCDRQNQ